MKGSKGRNRLKGGHKGIGNRGQLVVRHKRGDRISIISISLGWTGMMGTFAEGYR